MYCIKCGKQINDNAAFCIHCGFPTDKLEGQFNTRYQHENFITETARLDKKKNSVITKTIVAAILFMILIAVIGVLSSRPNKNNEAQVDQELDDTTTWYDLINEDKDEIIDEDEIIEEDGGSQNDWYDEEKRVKEGEEPIQCEFKHSSALARIGNSFSREIHVYTNVTGGTGIYEYYYEIFFGDSYATSNDPLADSISFTLRDNVDVTIFLTVNDSASTFATFEYHIDKVEN